MTDKPPATPYAETVGWNAGEAEFAQLFRRSAGRISGIFQFDRAAEGRPHAGKRFDQFRLSVAADAGDAIDLAGADLKSRIFRP